MIVKKKTSIKSLKYLNQSFLHTCIKSLQLIFFMIYLKENIIIIKPFSSRGIYWH
jgi:hypothetical protein